MLAHSRDSLDDSDDEGMGDSDEDTEDPDGDTQMQLQVPDDSGFVSTSIIFDPDPDPATPATHHYHTNHSFNSPKVRARHSAPSILPSSSSIGTALTIPKPNYKLLYQTHVRLHNRFLSASYRLSSLQMRGAPTNAHTNTIYCLQLYVYPSTGLQVLFTGSRDRSIREWNLGTGMVERVIDGMHESSVLSLCVANGLLASAGSDRKVVVWDLEENALVKVICDHEDSVLCVRFDERQLVSCSKGACYRLLNTYVWD
jgi:WD40 repeat protein